MLDQLLDRKLGPGPSATPAEIEYHEALLRGEPRAERPDRALEGLGPTLSPDSNRTVVQPELFMHGCDSVRDDFDARRMGCRSLDR